MTLFEQRLAWQRVVSSARPASLKIAVLASFTAHSLVPYLGLALEEAGLPTEVWLGPFHQIMPQCVYPQSEAAREKPDVWVVFSRLEELWSAGPRPLSGEIDHAEDALQVAESALIAARRTGSSLVFVLPAIPEAVPLGVGDHGHVQGVHAVATAVRERLRQRLALEPGVLVADMEAVVRQLGASASYHPIFEVVASIPYSEAAFCELGHQIARLVELSRRAAIKVLVVDADHTLWGGVVGEDGPDGIDLADNGPGEAFRAFQSYLLDLRHAGVLLALCSKNREEDVWNAFERPEMRLKREHLATWRVNWQAKSLNLLEMAAELGLGIDAFAMIDDNPAELAEIAAALPEVRTIRMPADPARWLGALQETRLLDRLPPTMEDRQRAEQYRQAQLRQQSVGALSPAEYLERLELRVAIAPLGPAHLARMHQLVTKTNQFNLNGLRLTEGEILELSSEPEALVRVVRAEDRFGDYGIVGAYMVRLRGPEAHLELFLLSCRALAKGIETAMLADAAQEAAAHGRERLIAACALLPRNEPARTFFARWGALPGAGPSLLTPCAWPEHIGSDRIPTGANAPCAVGEE